MVYILPLILVLFLMYHYDYRGHEKGRLYWYGVLLIYAILVAGLRYRIGGDTVVYSTNHYLRYPDIYHIWNYDFANDRFAPGYIILTSLARTISDNFAALQIILAIIVNSVIFRFFYKNTTKIFTALLLYFGLCYLNYNTEVLRESVAISFFLLGWEYFKIHKWWKYYLLCGIAMLFHPSASFTLLLPVFTLKPFHKAFSTSWVSAVCTFGLFGIGMYISSKFFDVIRLIGMASVDNYADVYENSGMGGGKTYNIVGKLIDVVTYAIYPLIVGWILPQVKNKLIKKEEKQKFDNSVLVMLFSYAYIGCLSVYIVILYRFNNYLILFFILGTADVVFHSIELMKKYYRLSYSIWALFLFPILYSPINRLFKPSGITRTAFIHRYYPYYSILDPKTDPEREKINYFYISRSN